MAVDLNSGLDPKAEITRNSIVIAKKKGHEISECCKLKNKEQKGNNNIQRFSEKSAKASITDNESQIDVLLVDGETRSKTEWILDFGCS